MFGHDAHDSSFNPDESQLSATNVRLLHVVWSAPRVSSAIATDSRVYVIRPVRFAASQVAVLYAADGKNLLIYTPAMLRLQRGAFDTPMALAHPDDTLLVANMRETVALNPHNGHLRWYASGGGTSMVVNWPYVYTGKGCQNPCGVLASYALDVRTGRRIWTHPGNFGQTPGVMNNLLYQTVGEHGAVTHVYNQVSGHQVGMLQINARWVGDAHRAFAFVLLGRPPGSASVGRSWVGEIAANGVAVWKADLGKILEGNPVLAYNTLFVPSNRHHPGVVALNATDGRYLWGADVGASSSMVVANHLLYVLNDAVGRVEVMRTSNGSVVRSVSIPGFNNRGNTGLMVAGGMLYVLGGNGLVAFRA
jgi:outer membrane protein assembly factor BamB